jgi:glycosyltransferase involved in cell wall biosynthesis
VNGLVICPVLPEPATDGSRKRTRRLLEAMQRAGVRPHLVTWDGRADAAEALRARGWRVYAFPERRADLPMRLRQHRERRPAPLHADVAAHLRGLAPPALVQVEHALAAGYPLPAAPVALSLHNVDSDMLATVARERRRLTPAWARAWNRALATRHLERREVPRADTVLAVSEADAAHFARLGGRPLVVPNGVDDELFAVADATVPDRVLFFGQLAYEPNALGLLRFLREGWPRIRERRPGARLRIAGPGADDRLVARLRAEPGVEPLGLVDDLRDELGRAVVVVPIWQGGGTRLKVLEALAAGRPTAGTPLGVSGIGVRDGEHALVAEAPAALAEAVVALLEHPARGAALGAAGRRLAERYRWALTTAPAEALYREWAARTPVQGSVDCRG